MGENSKIEWTHHTFNPWWGCTRVSPGCERCYAETFSKRVGQKVWGVTSERRVFGDSHWREPEKWNAAAEKSGERKRVFCASMADVFEDRRDLDAQRERLWRLIERTPMLDWLLLSKRPENMRGMLPWSTPRENVWLGATVEDRTRAIERIGELLRVPARVRFLSCEPLLEFTPIAVVAWVCATCRNAVVYKPQLDLENETCSCGRPSWHVQRIHWVIVGGESGPKSRPFDPSWAKAIIVTCRRFGSAPFVKQLGSKPIGVGALDDSKGGDWSEWPSDLRVREFPVVA